MAGHYVAIGGCAAYKTQNTDDLRRTSDSHQAADDPASVEDVRGDVGGEEIFQVAAADDDLYMRIDDVAVAIPSPSVP